jgi:hypothetical protein
MLSNFTAKGQTVAMLPQPFEADVGGAIQCAVDLSIDPSSSSHRHYDVTLDLNTAGLTSVAAPEQKAAKQEEESEEMDKIKLLRALGRLPMGMLD